MSSQTISPMAGKPLPHDQLVNLPRLMAAYYSGHPSATDPRQRVAFGTSGHRGSALGDGFNEDHIAAISQAVAEYRTAQKVSGPLFLGADTHALSEAAWVTAVEVLAANGVELAIDCDRRPVPTPAVSHAILVWNAKGVSTADGIVITPSHNPPSDGGFKYNPPNGGPADTEVTAWIEKRANALLESGLKDVKRTTLGKALGGPLIRRHDFLKEYVDDLGAVLDMEAIRSSGLRIGVDPLGNASVAYWTPVAERYGLDLTIVNPEIDATFRFVPADWDGKIRMDCSSPYAMAGLVEMKERYDIAFANDTDVDRHGIVTRSRGLLNPNHYLAVAIAYLFANRPDWGDQAGVGKTLVSSSMIDRVAAKLGRRLVEVPVGFKWFVDGLYDGSLGFGGEESAGASFLRRDGTVWTTDKDGPIMGLLAAEMTAKTGKDPGEQYAALVEEFGDPVYERIDAAATPEEKTRLKALAPDDVPAGDLAGDRVTAVLSRAPGNDAPIGGIKVTTERGWFAARPSGTEDVYKIYAESFVDRDHLGRIQEEAKAMVAAALKK